MQPRAHASQAPLLNMQTEAQPIAQWLSQTPGPVSHEDDPPELAQRCQIYQLAGAGRVGRSHGGFPVKQTPLHGCAFLPPGHQLKPRP